MKKNKEEKIVRGWGAKLDLVEAVRQTDNPSGRPPKGPLPKRWQSNGRRPKDETREWNRKARR